MGFKLETATHHCQRCEILPNRVSTGLQDVGSDEAGQVRPQADVLQVPKSTSARGNDAEAQVE